MRQFSNSLHDRNRAGPVQHQQRRSDTAQKRRQTLHHRDIVRLVDRLGNGVFDPRQVENALPNHGFRDLAVFAVLVAVLGIRHCYRHTDRHDQAEKLLVEAVLDMQQRCRYPLERCIASRIPATMSSMKV